MHDVICANCGKPTQVPFLPTGSRPVYCQDCFQAARSR
jgi:CxxC-x17-CxxC domain-containing protein